MAQQVQFRRGTTTEHSTFIGALGEVTVDTTKNVVVVHDGATAGGTPLLKASDVASNVPSASETVQGKIEIATQTEVNAATDITRAVTPQTLLLGIKNHLNVTDNAPMFACRAWVNFNGTGTVAIRASGNVSSITDNGSGSYTVNFTTALQDTNYSVVGISRTDGSLSYVTLPSAGIKTTSAVELRVTSPSSGTNADSSEVNVSVFR